MNNQSTTVIETKAASLDTLSVTIKALHVNSKQMTLAVFRQLPIAEAYKDDGTLNTDLTHWGIVRYNIKDESPSWIVASKDGRLFRCATKEFRKWDEETDYFERRLQTLILQQNEFAQWAKYWIAYNAWRKADYETRGQSPKTIQKPSHVGRCETDEISLRNQNNDYLEWIDNLRQELKISKEIDQSLKKILDLPQLFIAV